MKRFWLGAFFALGVGNFLVASAFAEEPAAAAAAAPAWNVVGTFGAWEVRCPRDEGSGRPCSAVLEVMESESRRVLLAWTFTVASDGKTVAVFYTPTGVRIQPGVEVEIDGAAPLFRLPFVGCRSEGCNAEGVLTPELLTRVRAGAKARVSIINLEGRAFNFEIPITGLADALNGLPPRS